MDKVIDFLQKEYGIKEDERYYIIIFKSEQHNEKIQIKGDILNFSPSQIVLKSDKGLFIIKTSNVVEMRPIKNKNS